MDLKKLYVFYLAAVHNTMKTAAEHLNVSPPAISMQIRALEAQLGVTLFARVKGRLRLTEQGAALYAVLKPAFDQLGTVEQYLASLQKESSQTLRFGFHPMAGRYFITELLEHVQRRCSGLRIVVSLGTQQQFAEMLMHGELDVALRIGPMPDYPHLEGVPVFDADVLLTTANPLLFRGAGTVSIRDLQGAPLILQQKGTGARAAVMHLFEQAGVTPHIVMDDITSDVIKEFLPQTGAMAFLGYYIVRKELESGQLRAIHISDARPQQNFQLMYHSVNRDLRKIRDFVGAVLNAAPALPVYMQ